MKTKMKSVLFSVMAAVGLSLALPAQAQSGGDAAGKPNKERRDADPAERLQRMKEHLGLSDAQVTEIKAIFAAEREEVMAKRKELGKDATPEDRKEAMQEIRAKYRTQLEAVLTEDQKAMLPKGDRGPKGPKGPAGGGQGAGGPPDA